MPNPLILAEGSGTYIGFGIFQVSVANALIMGAMIVVFVLALLIPFPRHGADEEEGPR